MSNSTENNDTQKEIDSLIEEYENIISVYEEMLDLLTTNGERNVDYSKIHTELEKVFSREDLDKLLANIHDAESRYNNKENLKEILRQKGVIDRASR